MNICNNVCVANTHSSCDGLILLEPVIYASRDDIAPIRPVAASLILWQEFTDMSGKHRHGTLLYYIHNATLFMQIIRKKNCY